MLYLIRHADALDSEPDEERPLSPRGLEQAARMGGLFRGDKDLAPDEIWHSPMRRAVETAEIMAKRAGWKAKRLVLPELQPDEDPAAVAARLESFRGTLAVVGHNPHLTILTTLLVTGRSYPPAFLVRKCSCIGLEPARGQGQGCWIVTWHLLPEFAH
jgi:phosphohistidine phosphatase